MNECLKELAAELSSAGLKPGSYSTHGLALENRDLRYSWDDAFRAHVGLTEAAAAVMSNLEEDTDPSPLFLIYTDEDYPDAQSRDTLRRCLVNQVHAQLVCDLNQLPPGELYERSAESLLLDMTDKLYQYLGRQRQKRMRRLLVENVFRRIGDFCKDRFSGAVNVRGQELKIAFPDDATKADFFSVAGGFSSHGVPYRQAPG
jgi:hypothetical protein